MRRDIHISIFPFRLPPSSRVYVTSHVLVLVILLLMTAYRRRVASVVAAHQIWSILSIISRSNNHCSITWPQMIPYPFGKRTPVEGFRQIETNKKVVLERD